jgi:hypothetical protein
MLHITDGESIAGTLRESGLPGEVIVEGDLLSSETAQRSLSRPDRRRFLTVGGGRSGPVPLRRTVARGVELAPALHRA